MLLYYLCLESIREGRAASTHVNEIIRGLSRRGWTVCLFAPHYPDTSAPAKAHRRVLKHMHVQWKLCLAREKPDAIYIRSHFAALPSVLWARWKSIPVIQEVNGPYDDLFMAWPWTRRFAYIFRWLMRKQLQWADAIITVTPGLAKWVCQETGTENVYVVPNGVNTELFHPGATADIAGLPEAYVVFFGALAPWQGIETLLAAVQDPKWPETVSLVVVGDGVERAKVETAAHSGKVVYLGSVPYQEMPGIVAQSLASVSPKSGIAKHRTVGLSPLKVYETLACGVPIVVTDIAGQADLIKEGQCGLVVPAGDPTALAEAVAYLYLHPDERVAMGKRGRELVERAHSWDQRAGAIANILERVLATGDRHA